MPASTSQSGRFFNAAAAAFRRGYFDKSVELYSEGLRSDPGCTAARLDLAKASEHLGDWAGALRALDVSLEQEPDHPVGLRRRGRVREEQAVFDKLVEDSAGPVVDDGLPAFELSLASGVDRALGEVVERALGHAGVEFASLLGVHVEGKVAIDVAPAPTPRSRSWPPWVSGLAHADGRLSVFLPGARPAAGLIIALIRHEYAHLVVREAAQRPCPHWLDEAIAAALTKPLMEWERAEVVAGVASNRSLSLAELDLPCSELPNTRITMAYRQYAVLGDSLIRVHGGARLGTLLRSPPGGKTADDALRKALQVTAEELEESGYRG